jgi:hypothetical protein
MTTGIKFDPAAPVSVPEGSSVSFTVRLYEGATLTAPTTLFYRVDDVTSGDNVLDWTTATATTTATISIAASLNVMVDEDRRVERKVLTVEANQGTATARNGSAYYDVVNVIGN